MTMKKGHKPATQRSWDNILHCTQSVRRWGGKDTHRLVGHSISEAIPPTKEAEDMFLTDTDKDRLEGLDENAVNGKKVSDLPFMH